MRCPSCDSEIVDEQAVFCPRCGGALSSPEVEVTEKLQVPAVAAPDNATDTEALEQPGGTESQGPARPSVVRDFAETVRRTFVARWLDATAAACLGFLVLLCIGALLLVAAKLQFPAFGAGADPIEILTAITILGLAVLRAPIHFGNLLVTTLPFGALVAAGAGIAWATRLATKDRGGPTTTERALAGARVGIPFALICWLAALVFRFRGGDEVFAGAWGALFWGGVWGAAFGALGSAATGAGRIIRLREMVLAPSEGPVRRGIAAGVVMLTSAAVLAAVATLIGIIVALVRGAPRADFGAGDAGAAVVYLLAFAPNVLVAMTALGLGSAVDVGARVTVAGGKLGSLRELSYFSWGGDGAPGAAYLLVLVPLAATVLGGFYARRRGEESPAVVLGVAAATFAIVLFVIALLGDARLGGGLAGRGVAHVSVHAFRTLLMAGVWGAIGGFAGWKLAETQKRSS